ncbi:cyclin-domain-containing protein [Pilobolus umbonatus]|nr:cyclin-domain-containing protein [Pilobolus umbonatus]
MKNDYEKKHKQSYHEQQRTYVSALVDVTVQVIGSIWPNSVSTPTTTNTKSIADLNTFLHHILKHSRTTHSTLQLAIFYLFRIRSRVQEKRVNDPYVSCGRRMFLAALISAHKYLQDKTYKNSAWSKVSGLNVQEINYAEKVMLELLDYRLYVKKDTYDQWIFMLQSHLKAQPNIPSGTTKPKSHHNQTGLSQERLESFRKAQLTLLSPPLAEDACMPAFGQKRKQSDSDITENKSKRHC